MRVRLFPLLASLVALPGQAADCLKIGVASGGVSTAAVARIADRIFSTAGSCAEILVLPNNRLVALTESGEVDGEAFKTQVYLDQHPALLLVPSPVYVYSGNLYWPAGTPEPQGAGATVGIMLGQLWPKAAAQARGLGTFEVRSYEQMIEMSHSGRLQGFMMAAEAFAQMRPRYEFLATYAAYHVADIPLHLLVNKRYQALVPALDHAIQTLLASGEIDREMKAEDR